MPEPGQGLYEQFCREEWEGKGWTWNRWEVLGPELKADWARAEITGLGNPAARMREMSGDMGDLP